MGFCNTFKWPVEKIEDGSKPLEKPYFTGYGYFYGTPDEYDRYAIEAERCFAAMDNERSDRIPLDLDAVHVPTNFQYDWDFLKERYTDDSKIKFNDINCRLLYIDRKKQRR